MLDLLKDFDRILSTCPQFMLGTWLQDARQKGTTDQVTNNLTHKHEFLFLSYLSQMFFDKSLYKLKSQLLLLPVAKIKI